MFEFHYFIAKISMKPMNSVNIKHQLVFDSIKNVCQTIKECAEKFYPEVSSINIRESTYINSKDVKFQCNDIDPNAPDILNKE